MKGHGSIVRCKRPSEAARKKPIGKRLTTVEAALSKITPEDEKAVEADLYESLYKMFPWLRPGAVGGSHRNYGMSRGYS